MGIRYLTKCFDLEKNFCFPKKSFFSIFRKKNFFFLRFKSCLVSYWPLMTPKCFLSTLYVLFSSYTPISMHLGTYTSVLDDLRHHVVILHVWPFLVIWNNFCDFSCFVSYWRLMVPKCFLSTLYVLFSSYTPISMRLGTYTCVLMTSDIISMTSIDIPCLTIFGGLRYFLSWLMFGTLLLRWLPNAS